MKWPVLFIGIVLVAAVLVFAVSYGLPGATTAPAPATTTSAQIIPGVASIPYSNTDYAFSIEQPETARLETAGFDGFLPVTQRPVAGFQLPQSLFQGTNLVDAGIYIGASSDTKAVNGCLSPSGDGEQTQGAKTIGDTVFQVFSSTGVGAGNVYEETSFRTVRSGSCYEIVELLHSGNIGNYPAGQVKQFDHDFFGAILDKMLHTFSFTGSAGSGVEGKVNTECKTDPSDPACVPQIRTIEAYQGISSVALFKSSSDGTFHSALPPGQYELRVDTASSTHCASVGIVVTDNSFITTDISCQAGVQE